MGAAPMEQARRLAIARTLDRVSTAAGRFLWFIRPSRPSVAVLPVSMRGWSAMATQKHESHYEF